MIEELKVLANEDLTRPSFSFSFMVGTCEIFGQTPNPILENILIDQTIIIREYNLYMYFEQEIFRNAYYGFTGRTCGGQLEIHLRLAGGAGDSDIAGLRD